MYKFILQPSPLNALEFSNASLRCRTSGKSRMRTKWELPYFPLLTFLRQCITPSPCPSLSVLKQWKVMVAAALKACSKVPQWARLRGKKKKLRGNLRVAGRLGCCMCSHTFTLKVLSWLSASDSFCCLLAAFDVELQDTYKSKLY